MRQASPPGGIWGGPGLQTRPEAVATAVAGTGCVGSRQKHSNKYMTLQEEITRRRTFAVIAHPDAGKTTLTEKLLLFGGAIHVAGAVKSNKIKKGATSDFMEIERQRGISVATAVMGFEYKGTKINILDTPGHEDFAEDTYRTLTAVDSVIIVIDGAKGVESQTRKLMEVCRMRSTPVIVFINKLDRPSKEPFDLLDEVEKELRIRVRPLAFPISNGPTFRGVYNLYEKNLSLFTSDEKLTADAQTAEISDLASPELDSYIGAKFAEQLRSDVELVEGVYDEFDREAYLRGELAPVFFGSALTTFGVEPFLEEFLRMTTPPLPRVSDQGEVDVFSEDFSAFVFKIQANMNKAHRDRLAFMRICSGKFERDAEYYHVQGGKKMRLSQPQQLMASEREIVDEAYAGDIIGVFDPGIVSIGDTICTKENIRVLPRLRVDEPTVAMRFTINTSPLAGREGKNVQSRKIRDRLLKEALINVAIKIEEPDEKDSFIVKGRGEFQMAILIETMRREDFELCVGRPEVIFKRDENGQLLEPIEQLYVDCDENFMGVVTDKIAQRKGRMVNCVNNGTGRVRLEFSVPSRGLIGYRDEFLTDTKGEGIMASVFDSYAPYKGDISRRGMGSLISTETGDSITYGLFNAQERGTLFIGAGVPVYEGMIIGVANRGEDIVVNACRKKQLTNTRASGSDDALRLVPPRQMSLEQCLEFLADDELLEVTPKSLRMRKAILNHEQRMKSLKGKK